MLDYDLQTFVKKRLYYADTLVGIEKNHRTAATRLIFAILSRNEELFFVCCKL